MFFLFFFFYLIRNSGLGSNPTRNSMITQLRMVWEVTLFSRVSLLLFLGAWHVSLCTYYNLHDMAKVCLFSMAASALELQRNTASSSSIMARSMNEYVLYFSIFGNIIKDWIKPIDREVFLFFVFLFFFFCFLVFWLFWFFKILI